MTEHRLMSEMAQRLGAAWRWLASGFLDGLPSRIRPLVVGDERLLEVEDLDGDFRITLRRWPGAPGTSLILGNASAQARDRLRAMSRRCPVHLIPRDALVLTREVSVPLAALRGGRDMVALNFEAWTAFPADATAYEVRTIAVGETAARLRIRFVPTVYLNAVSTRLEAFGVSMDRVTFAPLSRPVIVDHAKARRVAIRRAVDVALLASVFLTGAVLVELERRDARAERDAALEQTRALLDQATRAAKVRADLTARRGSLGELVSSLAHRETASLAVAELGPLIPAEAEVEALEWSKTGTRVDLLLPPGVAMPSTDRAGRVRQVVLGESESGRRVQLVIEERGQP